MFITEIILNYRINGNNLISVSASVKMILTISVSESVS